MRNTGWYVPYWRKSKKKGRADKPSSEEIARSDEQLEAVRLRWIDRYRRTARSLKVLNLSMGSNRSEVQARYEALCATGKISERELEDAYRHLLRILPSVERRKRRPSGQMSQVHPMASGDGNNSVAEGEGPLPTAAAYADQDEAEGEISEDDSDELSENEEDNGDAFDTEDLPETAEEKSDPSRVQGYGGPIGEAE